MNSRLAFLLLIVVSVAAARQTARGQPASNQSTNAAPQIVLLTIEGTVEVAPAGTLNWAPARTNQVLNIGDRVHTGEGSRATILLLDRSIQRVGSLTTLEILAPTQPGKRLMFDLKAGKSYLLNREKPTELQFRTPLASGAIRGTEFELSVDEATGRTLLTLIEGEVELSNPQGDLALVSGDQGVVEPGQAPRKSPALDTRNIIQWTLYYPAVLVVAEVQMDAADQVTLADSLAAYRAGDAGTALVRYPAGRQPATDAERLYRAALFLSAGDVPKAEALLGAVAENSSVASGLRRLIAAVKGETFTGPAPTTATASLAESYYRQSRSDLAGALRAASVATAWAPGFGPAYIRVAELEMGFGRMNVALENLQRGLELAPRHAQGIALTGFVLAQQSKTRQAERFFNEAIAIDPALANAWVGRGLCKYRHGDKTGGREDLLVAATLEPNRSVLRSYLGKAWTAENNLRNAEKDLRLAQQFDPNDPTSWLYLALLQRQDNRINEAVDNLERSKDLNYNRSLFQSRLRLDQDLATRSANLAGIYRDAGMTEWGTREASRAVNYDYGNYSAHLFLANSYDALRDPKLVNLRYETPWLSEQLVANLLAPAVAGAFPLNIAEEPASRSFQGDHVGIISSTEYFSSGEWIQRGSEYGILGNSSFSIDAYYHTDPGQRPNNDLEQTWLQATFKQQLSARDSLFLRAETFWSESGDVAQYYDQSSAALDQRVHERQDPNAYVGWHREWSPGSHTLVLAGYLEDNLDFDGSFGLTTFAPGLIPDVFITQHGVNYETDFKALTAEIQQIWQNERHTVIIGGRVQAGQVDTTSIVTNNQFLQFSPTRQSFENDLARASGYGYWFWQVARPLQLQAGVSYDYLDYPENAVVPPISDDQERRDQVSPKVGFQYAPWTNTMLRGAWTRSLGGVYFDTSVRLEPTQVGGFNQAFRSIAPESVVGLVPGTRFETFGLAYEQKFPTRTYVTVAGELLYSDGDRMIGAFELALPGPTLMPTSIKQNINFRERTLAASVNQLLGKNWSLGATYRLTDADLESEFHSYESITQSGLASTHDEALLNQVTLFANYNCRCGFFAQGWSTWSHQDNKGGLEDSDFWQHNVAVGYRLPKRHVELRVSLLNITDEDYNLNPITLYYELPRERTLAVGFKFYF